MSINKLAAAIVSNQQREKTALNPVLKTGLGALGGLGLVGAGSYMQSKDLMPEFLSSDTRDKRIQRDTVRKMKAIQDREGMGLGTKALLALAATGGLGYALHKMDENSSPTKKKIK